jgi:hypothetical protein
VFISGLPPKRARAPSTRIPWPGPRRAAYESNAWSSVDARTRSGAGASEMPGQQCSRWPTAQVPARSHARARVQVTEARRRLRSWRLRVITAAAEAAPAVGSRTRALKPASLRICKEHQNTLRSLDIELFSLSVVGKLPGGIEIFWLSRFSWQTAHSKGSSSCLQVAGGDAGPAVQQVARHTSTSKEPREGEGASYRGEEPLAPSRACASSLRRRRRLDARLEARLVKDLQRTKWNFSLGNSFPLGALSGAEIPRYYNRSFPSISLTNGSPKGFYILLASSWPHRCRQGATQGRGRALRRRGAACDRRTCGSLWIIIAAEEAAEGSQTRAMKPASFRICKACPW